MCEEQRQKQRSVVRNSSGRSLLRLFQTQKPMSTQRLVHVGPTAPGRVSVGPFLNALTRTGYET